jgi:organic radical activating enzyme
MQKLKVSELFYSIQGEGRYMGVPSVFLRTFGCNFTCDSFGMKRGEKSQERHQIADRVAEFKQYRDLPLVSTGCDSYASWDPRFKDLSPLITTEGIVEAIMDMLPHKEWREEHLVITGGEPLLGWQRAYPELLSHDKMAHLPEITFETNGTQPLSKELRHFLLDWTLNPRHGRRGRSALTFSVSAKLPVSGEKWSEAIQPEVVCQYQEVGYTYLKFVIASTDDFADAQCAIAAYRAAGFTGPIYLMPLGGVESVYSMNNRLVAEIAMRHGLRYSDRLQVPLFKNEWGT